MRVIAGKFRSRNIWAPEGMDTRPTSDRLRETIFNVLAAREVPNIEGATFLDLYAGSGAVGIEAISRGAASVVFVESNKRAARTIRENLAGLKVTSGVEVIEREVVKAIPHLAAAGRSFDIVFLDPPYASEGQYEAALEALAASTLITSDSLVIAEHTKHYRPEDTYGRLSVVRRMQHGDAALAFYQLSA
jgi:16S rRNA (guanine(966)-N(2))-methyltransferase RsmD